MSKFELVQFGRPVKMDSIKLSSSRLLKVLFGRDYFLSKYAREKDLTPHNLTNWWRKGRVPIHQVGEVSRKLKVPPYALNYSETCDIMSTYPEWGKVLSKCRLSAAELSYIKKGTPP